MRLIKRIRNKILRETSRFMDSYSFFFNLPLPQKRLERLSEFAKISGDVKIAGKIIIPTPQYLEVCNNVSIKWLNITPKKFVLIEKDSTVKNLACPHHTIITKSKIYRGKEIPAKVVTISIDFEGGVALSNAAFREWDHLKKFWDSSKAVEELAQLFKQYEIPVTWAICGHLFLKECDGHHGILEKDWYGDWFQHDPATNYKKNSAWYMPETIQRLAEEPLFEIGYHSFGHYLYQNCSEDTVNKDVLMAEKIRAEWRLRLDTFVFPYNQLGYLDLLANKGGFSNFRGNIGFVYPAYDILDFGEFRFFNTTQMFSPKMMKICHSQLESIQCETFNYYTHCHQWIGREGWNDLEDWLKALKGLRESNKIILKRMDKVF